MSVSDHSTEYSDADSPDARTSGLSTLRNGLVGGVVAILLSVLPFSTVIGGGLAGYLDRKSGHHGSGAGAVAGTVAFVPYLVVGTYLVLADVALPGPELSVSPTLLVAGVTAFAFVYTVGLGVLGGLAGAYVREDV